MRLPAFQIDLVSIYKFFKKLKYENFKIGSLFRAPSDPVVTIPKSGTGGDRPVQ